MHGLVRGLAPGAAEVVGHGIGPGDQGRHGQRIAVLVGDRTSALARNGERAASDAARLDLPPLTLAVDGEVWTLRRGDRALEAVPGGDAAALRVTLDGDAFADLVHERRTALGLAVAGRVGGDGPAPRAFDAWDAVLRSALDGRGVHRPGDVALRALDGSPLDLDLADRSATLRDLFADPPLPRDRRAPRRRPPSRRSVRRALRRRDRRGAGEAGRLRRRAGLPAWHKDCQRGGHSMYRSGLTVGFCLTPVDEAHGGLDVIAGSHRTNIAGAQIDHGAGLGPRPELDLPGVRLRAGRGDITVHMSCALHRSTHPASHERRVVYSGFTLPARPGDHRGEEAQQRRLRSERAAVGDPGTATRIVSGTEPGGARR